MMHFLTIFILLLSSPVYSADAYNRILQGLTPNSITIIGETHRQPEAVRFFRSLITSHLQQNSCLTIGLEIASSQQSLLDEMAEGNATVADIEITPIIDHPIFRALIADLAEMQKHNEEPRRKQRGINPGEIQQRRTALRFIFAAHKPSLFLLNFLITYNLQPVLNNKNAQSI